MYKPHFFPQNQIKGHKIKIKGAAYVRKHLLKFYKAQLIFIKNS